MARLSAFSDEAMDDFRGQVEYLVSEKVGYMEPRFLDGKNIMDLNKAELDEAKKLLDDNGIKVCAIGSPIGKVRVDEDFGPHLDKFKHAVDLAVFLNAPLIRMFSYYAPDGKNIVDYRDDVLDRMAKKVEVLKDIDVTMVHENEADIFGQNPEACVDMVKTIDSPKFRLAYDPANFALGLSSKDTINSCWPVMKDYVVHIHIKDWKVGEPIGSMPGQGDAQIKELLAVLAEINYDGCMTMEPHLQQGGQFGGKTGPELFSKAIAAVRQMADEVGLKVD